MNEEILLLIGAVVIGLPGAINTIGSAVEKVVKAKKAVNAPNEKQDREIEELKRRVGDVEKKLENDKKELVEIREGNRVTALSLIALLDHSLDGNNIKQMQNAKDELSHWLAKK